MAFLYGGDNRGPAGLRRIIEEERGVPVPGVFTPVLGILFEKMGFKALYLSGAALTGSYGMPDLGIITLTEVAETTRRVVRVTTLPLIVDADTGFGEAINVQRTVRELEEAGAAAIQIEDQVLPKKCGHLRGKRLVPPDDMVRKIRASVRARRKGVIIIARTDARSVEGLDSAIARARLYAKAGADIIFPEALETREEFRIFAEEIETPLLANMTEFGRSPLLSYRDLGKMGYSLVIYPVSALRIALHAIKKGFESIMEQGTQEKVLGSMMTREEFYNLIGYWDYERIDDEINNESNLLLKN